MDLEPEERSRGANNPHVNVVKNCGLDGEETVGREKRARTEPGGTTAFSDGWWRGGHRETAEQPGVWLDECEDTETHFLNL